MKFAEVAEHPEIGCPHMITAIYRFLQPFMTQTCQGVSPGQLNPELQDFASQRLPPDTVFRAHAFPCAAPCIHFT